MREEKKANTTINVGSDRHPAAHFMRRLAAGFLFLCLLLPALSLAAQNVKASESAATGTQNTKASESAATDAQNTKASESAAAGALTANESETGTNGESPDTQTHKHILVLFSYSPSWEGEREVYEGLIEKLSPMIRLDLVYMDTKNIDRASAEELTEKHIRLLQDRENYDAVIAVDDDALDYVMLHRDREFAGLPVIFCNINSWERAAEAAKDPLTTGIYENFYGAETVEAAKKLYPEATRVVGISDHSLTGKALSQRFLELSGTVGLKMQMLDMLELSREEITRELSSYGKDTILIYLTFTQDGEGNLYGMEEAIQFLIHHARIPLFKQDQAGIGAGVQGGCGVSFEETGRRCAELTMEVLYGNGAEVLRGTDVEEMEGQYVFDASLLDRYGIEKSMLPAGTLFVREKKSFWSKYAFMLRPVIVVMLMMIIIVALLVADRRRLRSLASSQEQLSDAETRRLKAESQASAVSRFLASVTHDLRTPLSSIIGYTDLALGETDEAKRKEFIENTRSSANLMTDIVNDTLDISRVISGKTRINPVLTTFGRITSDINASVGETARKKRVRYSCTIQEEDTLIRVDQMKVKRVILNLLSNAVKFTPEGGQVTLAIEHLAERVNGCNFRICVTDTGIGMSVEFQKIMFEPFVQEHADPVQAGTSEGTGLGLTIVRKYTEQMGGFMDIHSEVGKGTAISAYLPVDIRESEQLQEETPRPRDYGRLKGMNVLVAEDSDMNAEVVRVILAKKGITCTCVDDGRKAVETFGCSREGTFAAIFMDLRMPGMDGCEASRRIRAMKRPDAKEIPIYALSADAYAKDEIKAEDAGMNGHIAKPVHPDDLYDVLMDLNIR